MRPVHGVPVRGVDVGPETRCAHYAGDRDVVAIRFPCCEAFYPCFDCHEAVADHAPSRWGPDDGDEAVVLCGVCGRRLRLDAYVGGDDACPACDAAFNPGCRNHYHRYFEESAFGESPSE